MDRQTSRYSRVLEDAEMLRFSASGKNAVSTMVAFSPDLAVAASKSSVNQLSFSWDERAQPGGPARRTSRAPRRAHDVRLLQNVTLGEGERLSLEQLRGRITELRIDKQIHLSLEGDVADIVIGTKGFERNLMPTYLEYFRSHPSLGFFWSAAVFLAGSLWSAKRLLLS